MHIIFFLIFAFIFGGCGTTVDRFREVFETQGGEAWTQQAQPLETPSQQGEREGRAVENLPYFRSEVVPRLRPIASDLVKRQKKMNPDYTPEVKLIEEAVELYNHQHPTTPITQLDMDTFYLTDQGRRAFFFLLYISN